jgi:acetyl coenzyme A synthetase (ADP forming)-like protein
MIDIIFYKYNIKFCIYDTIMSTNHQLSNFFNPKSIAVIGASATPGKVGYNVLKNIIVSGFTGKIFPINPKADELKNILDYPAYKSVLDVPEEIDIAIFVIPAKLVNPIAEECGRKNVKGLVVISAGFKEIGGEGITREQELVSIARKYNMRVIGPNCLGFVGIHYNGSFAANTPKEGGIAMISQSGAMLTGMMDYSMEQSFGFSCNISLGNKADLDEVDFIEYLVEDDDTKVILCYLESIDKGEKFLKVVPAAARKKPIIILKAGISEAGARAASSHTGALAGSDIAYELSFKKSGVIRAKTISDLFDYGEIFLYQPIPKENSFAIITNAGGPGIVATDAFEKEGLKFATFSEPILHLLRENLPKEAAIFNPVDIVGDASPQRYVFTINTIFGLNHSESNKLNNNDEITTHGALIIMSPQAQTHPNEVAKLIHAIRTEKLSDKPIVCSLIGGISMHEATKYLKDHHIPCYPFPEEAAQSLKALVDYSNFRKVKPMKIEDIPKFKVGKEKVESIFTNAREDQRTVLLSSETSEIFESYGIQSPKTRLARTPREAMKYQKEIGKVVMKIVSPQIIHKTDVGGIILDINTPEEAFEAYIQIVDNAKKFGPQTAKVYGVEIQEMIDFKKEKKVNELIIGMSRDPQFGPLLMVGSGGIYANFLKDVSFALSYNFTEADAKEMLQKTKIFSLLQGVRGESASDIDSIIEVLLRLSQLVNDFPEIVELDINPLLSFIKGYSAVDIKITISR